MTFSRWLVALLVPHALSAICFLAAFVWMAQVGNNRSDPDLILAILGFIGGAIALCASLGVAAAVLFRRDRWKAWPWLGLHLAALCGVALLASSWFAAHLV